MMIDGPREPDDPYPELDTPSVLVDLNKLEENLADMAGRASRAGVRLRPHTKTHKTTWIANKQLESGASGITVAKLGEAEVMAAAGIDDVLVAFPLIGAAKLERLATLAATTSVTLALDSADAAYALDAVGRALQRRLPVYVEVDCGLRRCGLPPGRPVVEFVQRVSQLPWIEIHGLMTHAGHATGSPESADLHRVAMAEASALAETAEALENLGIAVPELSLGSTPTAFFIEEVKQAYPRITEFRPGTYVFYDVNQMTVGVATESQCALRVLATVVSRPAPDRIVIDAGSKTLGGEVALAGGYGRVRGAPDVRVVRISEEHGVLRVPFASPWRIGDRLEIIPAHACAVPNLADQLIGIRGDVVERRIPIEGRGRNQ